MGFWLGSEVFKKVLFAISSSIHQISEEILTISKNALVFASM